MKSCRFSFAVHVMAVLAVEEGECCSSSRLAQTVNTNPVVIRRLLLELHHAGLVRTRRGPQGGAVLSRRPDRINLLQIQAAVDPQELFGLHPNPPSSECPVGRRIGGRDGVHSASSDSLLYSGVAPDYPPGCRAAFSGTVARVSGNQFGHSASRQILLAICLHRSITD